MSIGSKEHYDLMDMFERSCSSLYLRVRDFEREKNKELWKSGHVYQNGEVNELFKAFRLGYSYGITQ